MSKKAISGEVQMFGQSTESIRAQYMNSITAKLSGQEMVVAGILSDCQELLSMLPTTEAIDEDRSEMIRKQLNVAKFVLFEMMNAKESV
jgi:NAD(P)H-hydrate repair Nnr-like enzyme with NAD(P)H-hydrate dehydratase domain